MEKQLNSNTIHIDDGEALISCAIASSSGVLQMVLNAAVQLDLFEIIHKAAGDDHDARISAREIASQLPTNNLQDAVCVLDSMLQLLSSNCFLTCSITHQSPKMERLYGLSPAGKYFVKDESGMSLAPWGIIYCDNKLMDVCSGIKDAVLEGGILFERFHGRSLYEYTKSNPESNEVFNDAMGSLTTIIMKKSLEIYNGFGGLNSIVNVGGGNGVTLDMIISKYPYIQGINFDLPQVIQTAPSYNGIKHVSGDMFLQVPKGDAMLLKGILHNWNDDQCLKLLKNCYKALPNKGKVIVMDPILPEIPQTNIHSKFASQMNFLMLTLCGGKERTKTEFEALAIHAGFSEFRVVGCAHVIWIMEFIK